MNLISKKKKSFKISASLRKYLHQYGRLENVPVQYEDLLRVEHTLMLKDRSGKDTHWLTVLYRQDEAKHIHEGIKKIYAILKAGGDLKVIQHLYVDRIDLCEYANSQPFRIRIVNKLNENFDYFYIKRADASRIYGLELEHLLSPNRITYFVSGDTLIEEHIVGIPADIYIKQKITDRHFDETRLAKEFVKFNERCFVRLLGDMHSSNFVIDVTPDFEETHYRMRSIDFDQQSYEQRKTVYMPQFFKQNKPFVELVRKNLSLESITQYQLEERALILQRIRTNRHQVKDLVDTMMKDDIAPQEYIENLKQELAKHYNYDGFLKCKSMGALLRMSLRLLLKPVG